MLKDMTAPNPKVTPEVLVLAIVQDTDAGRLTAALADEGIDATKLASTGGFLREGNTTLMIGVPRAHLEPLKALIQATCRTRTRMMSPAIPMNERGEGLAAEPIEVEVGGAVVFVLGVEEFTKL